MSSSWTARIPGAGSVTWSSKSPHLTGDDGLVAMLRDELEHTSTVEVTPVGPYLDAVETNSLAVLIVLFGLTGQVITLSGDIPEPPAVPDGAVS